jgi:hypothetical protein
MLNIPALAKTRSFAGLALCLAIAAPAAAQLPPPSNALPPAAESAQQQNEIAPFVNVRLDLTILDQVAAGAPTRKTVTMYIADRSGANVRTTGRMLTREGWRDVLINVDARPTVIRGKNDAVRVDLGLEYRPMAAQSSAAPTTMLESSVQPTALKQNVVTILDSGKPILISQAADPSSDRRISVELKATIEK